MKKKYIAPEVDIMMVIVEKGFAGSNGEEGGGMSTPTIGGF